MQARRICRGKAECVYVSVRNAGTESLPVGRHAIYAFHSSTFADGVNVCTYGAGAGAVAWQLAGIVSKYPIPAGGFGLVQVYGYHMSVSCGSPYPTTTGLTNWTSVATLIITPVTSSTTPGWNAITTETSWVSYVGGVIRLAGISNASRQTSSSGYWPAFIRMM